MKEKVFIILMYMVCSGVVIYYISRDCYSTPGFGIGIIITGVGIGIIITGVGIGIIITGVGIGIIITGVGVGIIIYACIAICVLRNLMCSMRRDAGIGTCVNDIIA